MRITVVMSIICLFVGVWAGWKAKPVPAPIVRDRVVTQTQEKVVTRVVKEPGGTTTITKEVVRDIQSDKQVEKPAASKPAPNYRLTVLVPINDVRERPTVGAGMRVVSNFWVDAQFNLSTNTATIGGSYEF